MSMKMVEMVEKMKIHQAFEKLQDLQNHDDSM